MPSAGQLLIVSPDRTVRQAAQRCLIALGHTLHLARTVVEAQRTLARVRVDLICLDSLLPPDDSQRFWQWLRADHGQTPPLIFLAPPSAARVPGALPSFFERRRDSLVPKPIDGRELAREVARHLAAPARRRRERELLQVGSTTLDCENRQLLFANGGSLSPTPTEFQLLRCLMERPGEFLSPDELLEQVWNISPGMGTGGPELVRAHVSNLRRKLRSIGKDPHLVRTIPYRGYGFVSDQAKVG